MAVLKDRTRLTGLLAAFSMKSSDSVWNRSFFHGAILLLLCSV
ncbi:hypothetical protein BACCAP_02014 [Pseudoflavonifractor capillosus ATCC 29799]|uniref:Uncharacterized protein n=1 Tax=Pseudoflavonifractor capillosus ATCC 29799 TaxID=411467 RepID=A6NUX9_9FIRM|nr:hypothetical protein BACCAP_02014 [Pseudoflavonifractor capillosus ATCC 29799]